MDPKLMRIKTVLLPFVLAFLSGCVSYGNQHVPPADNENSAELFVEPGHQDFIVSMFSGSLLRITNLNEKGCPSGYTELDDNAKVKVHTDRLLILNVEKSKGQQWLCRGFYSFHPEAGAHYTLAAKTVGQCTLTIKKTDDGKIVPVPVAYLAGNNGLHCMNARLQSH